MGKHSETCQKHWKRCQTTKNQPRTTIGCIPDALGGVLEHFGSSVGLAKSQCSTNAYTSVEFAFEKQHFRTAQTDFGGPGSPCRHLTSSDVPPGTTLQISRDNLSRENQTCPGRPLVPTIDSELAGKIGADKRDQGR